MQKPCRHLASLSLGKLSDKLASSSPLNPNFCNSCTKETESPVYCCLTCLQSFCQPSHLNHHARERNHPLSFNLSNLNNEELNELNEINKINKINICESIEKYFYCSLCSNHPRISEPGKKERVNLEKVKGFFQENQKNEKSQKEQELFIKESESSIHNPSSKIVPKGIVNLGNTCFMNSALQLLAATLNRHGPLKITSSSPIWNSLIYHLEEIYSKITENNSKKKQGNSTTVNPREFLSLLCGKQKKFASMQQQDAHDFLRLLFNSVPEAPQIELFGGKFVSRVVCGRCKRVSDTNEPFLDISLAMPEEMDELSVTVSKLKLADDSYDDSYDHSDYNTNDRRSVTIDHLLKNWNKKIPLEGENGYYCESCSPQDTQILQSASLQFFLTDPLPPFLILHLQRFKTQISKSSSRKSKGSGGLCLTIEKDDRTVSFPLNLTISYNNYYRLYGYIIHEGASTSCGHYTAVVCASDDTWFYISDTRVKEISKSRALDPESYTPYLLFYQKS